MIGLKSKVKKTNEDKIMKGSNVNIVMARDLKSNAGDLTHQNYDFPNEGGYRELNEKALLSQRGPEREDDLRSMRSEYDYGSKKKFVDVLGPRNNALSSSRL